MCVSVCVHVCATARSLPFELFNSVVLYLHGVCFSRGGLPISKDGPIVSTKYIYDEKRTKRSVFKKNTKEETMWKWRMTVRVPDKEKTWQEGRQAPRQRQISLTFALMIDQTALQKSLDAL